MLMCLCAVLMMLMSLTCCIQQRQERFSDCSALLELERKVMHPPLSHRRRYLMMLLLLFLLMQLQLPHYCHLCYLLMLYPLFAPLEPLPHMFSLTLCVPLPPLPSPPPRVSLASGPKNVGATNGRAGGGAKGEESFYHGHKHFPCFCLISLALACAGQSG